MSEVRKGTSRNTENENKRCKISNKVLNMNWDYVRGKKTQKENKNKQIKRKQKKNKKIKKNKKKNLYDSLVLYLTKKWLNRNIFVIQLSDRVYNVTFPAYALYSLRLRLREYRS